MLAARPPAPPAPRGAARTGVHADHARNTSKTDIRIPGTWCFVPMSIPEHRHPRGGRKLRRGLRHRSRSPQIRRRRRTGRAGPNRRLQFDQWPFARARYQSHGWLVTSVDATLANARLGEMLQDRSGATMARGAAWERGARSTTRTRRSERSPRQFPDIQEPTFPGRPRAPSPASAGRTSSPAAPPAPPAWTTGSELRGYPAVMGVSAGFFPWASSDSRAWVAISVAMAAASSEDTPAVSRA